MPTLIERARSAARGWTMQDTTPLIRKSMSRVYTYELPGSASADGLSANRRQIAIEGYIRNAVVYRCARMIADTAAAVPFYVGAVGEHDDAGQLARSNDKVALMAEALLLNPQGARGDLDGIGFLTALYHDQAIWDEAFLVRVGGRWDATVALDLLRPYRARERTGKTGALVGWDYAVGGGDDIKKRFFARSRVCQIKGYNPINDFRGASPVAAAAWGVDVHNLGNASVVGLMQNQGRPSGVITYDGDVGLTNDQYEDLRSDLDRVFSSASNNGRPLLLDKGLGWQQTSLTPQDMAMVENAMKAAREIALAMGVPPMLLGIPGDNTYSNYQEARRAFYTETIRPLVRRTLSRLTAWMLWTPDSFGGVFGNRGVMFAADWSQVPVIAEARMDRMAALNKIDFMTIEERRKEAGLPAVPARGMGTILVGGIQTPLADVVSGADVAA